MDSVQSGSREKLIKSYHLEEGEVVTRFPYFVDGHPDGWSFRRKTYTKPLQPERVHRTRLGKKKDSVVNASGGHRPPPHLAEVGGGGGGQLRLSQIAGTP